ncbi:glycosyltransferase family 39 protein [Danxiaibacter flavus]|uniref:Glycosyltransferase family 39 protein n=1 Tax=Danxiaibacter flavus TaxID=3049108 RepID=A0ABV3ZFA1_9BACT|nr:glycosyltransferase family 39 protein [Chitinophagaceae bacterium DXS]
MKINKVLYLVLITTVIRIVLASLLELGNDEVYYYTYALHLQNNYFDHPPAVGILIKLFTFNLHFQSEVFIRLGSIVFAAIGTILSYRIGQLVRNERTGWFAAVLYNTSIYSSIIAGTFILPDSPQVVFWLAALYVMLRIVQLDKKRSHIPAKYWLWAGVLNGLCIMCKVHGIFLWGGLGLYILLYNRKMLLNPWLYLSFIITVIIFSPIIFWNIQNNFITWRYHSERVTVTKFTLDKDGFLQTIFGQIFYNNPINVVLTILAVISLRRRRLTERPYQRLLSLCGWPIIIVVTAVSLFRNVLPHWTGPGFMSLGFIAAAYLDEKFRFRQSEVWPGILKTTVIFMLILAVGCVTLVHFYPGTVGDKTSEENYGETDFTLDLWGWDSFGQQFNKWQDSAVVAGTLEKDLPLVCGKWFPAAHLDYYVARHRNSHVVGVGHLEDLHQYAWLNQLRGDIIAGRNALAVVPTNCGQTAKEVYSPYFSEITFLRRFVQVRRGKPARYFDVFLLKNFNAKDELHNKKFTFR